MLFIDGNRLDLNLVPLDEKEIYCREDKLRIILMDKDKNLSALAPPTDEIYRVKRPTASLFADCCNEFWWVSTYVAKGLWREETIYALEHLNRYVRPMLLQMLEWQVGIQDGFSVNIGKHAKFLKKFLPGEIWQELLTTYAIGNEEDGWKVLFAMVDLFHRTAIFVAEKLEFSYREDEEARVTSYLWHVRRLPADADGIY